MNEINWSKKEKMVARKAFNVAYKRECDSIAANLREMISAAKEPEDIWRIHDYLREQSRQVTRKYDYRYSVLIIVFARLFHEGWLTKSDLKGLSEDKIDKIKKFE